MVREKKSFKTWLSENWKGLTVILATSFLGGVLVVLLFGNQSFDSLIDQIDRQIVGGEVPALRTFRTVSKKAEGPIDWLRIIKRIFAVKDPDQKFDYLNSITALAVAEFPGNEDLWAYRISGQMWSGNPAAALENLEKLSGPKYLGLKAEVFVRYQDQLSREQEFLEGNPDDAAISDIFRRASGPQLYIELSKLLGEPRFAYNAALLYMGMGESERALSVVKLLMGAPWLNSFAAGLIAYDNEDWELAEEFFRDVLSDRISLFQPSGSSIDEGVLLQSLELLGSVYGFQQDYQKMVEVLSQAELLGKQLNELRWELYFNLSSAYRLQGNLLAAFEVLKEGRVRFPENGSLLLLSVFGSPADEVEVVRSMLRDYLEKGNEDPDVELASIIMNPSVGYNFSAKLWRLFNRFPSYEKILDYLLWYHLGAGYIDDMFLAIERYNNLVISKSPDLSMPGWVKEYKALGNVLISRLDLGRSELEEIFRERPRWHTAYNLSVVCLYQHDFDGALRYLRLALGMASQLPDQILLYYQMMVLSNLNGSNTFTAEEWDEIGRIVSLSENKQYESKGLGIDELFVVRLADLTLWYQMEAERKGLSAGSESESTEIGEEVDTFEIR